jgi:hypothetical protein
MFDVTVVFSPVRYLCDIRVTRSVSEGPQLAGQSVPRSRIGLPLDVLSLSPTFIEVREVLELKALELARPKLDTGELQAYST